MAILPTLRIIPGMTVNYRSESHVVLDLINATQILIKSLTGKRRAVNASEVEPDLKQSLISLPDMKTIEAARWQEAIEISEIIAPLVAIGPKIRTRSDVRKVADSIDKHISTVYRWLNDYESTGLVSSLLRKIRSDIGRKRLSEEVENLIQKNIEEFHLTEQKRTPTKTVFEVRKICKEMGLQPPDQTSVLKRIYAISGEVSMRRRRGPKAADENYEPIIGSFPGADYPNAVIQIDHTPVDVIIVDDEYRESTKRPYLTIAIDVNSKMCVNFYLSLDPPGGLATGICLSGAIIDKDAYLAKLGLEHLSWPCHGVMSKVHTDNAKEFKGTLLGKAALEYGIIVEHRPKGKPKYGGTVERAFRTFMHEVHNELPGTTFSNVKEKLEYNSEGKAVMTFAALEKWFALYILGVYHQTPHDGNDGLPPIVKWERGIFGTETTRGTGIPMRVPDEERLKIDFLPFHMRTVQEYGIQLNGFYYWADSLRRYIHMKNPEERNQAMDFVCRYDPRSLNKIWMYDPEPNKYIEVPYRDLTRPSVSLWEVKEAKRILRADSMTTTNEELIFKTIDQMRQLVEEESVKTKSARTKKQRQKQWAQAPKSTPNDKEKIKETKEEILDEDNEDEVFEPFKGTRES